MLYTGDWLKDPELSACSPATRGIWADWLCRMREQVAAGRRPRLSCCVEAFARLGRCSAEEALTALVELQQTEAASVTMSHDVTLRHAKVTDLVTLENRRMSREWKASQGAALRQREKRERDALSRPCHADVTLSSSSSSSSSKEKRTEDGSFCPERSEDGDVPGLDESRVVIRIPVVGVARAAKHHKPRIREDGNDGHEYAVTLDDGMEWPKAYPGIDIRQQLSAYKSWVLALPKERTKTTRGLMRSVTFWLGEAQDKATRGKARADAPRPGRVAVGATDEKTIALRRERAKG